MVTKNTSYVKEYLNYIVFTVKFTLAVKGNCAISLAFSQSSVAQK
jgi:hypothetical protein